jgi:hypothetical protein
MEFVRPLSTARHPFTALNGGTGLYGVFAAPADGSKHIIESIAVSTGIGIRKHQPTRSVIAVFGDPPLDNGPIKRNRQCLQSFVQLLVLGTMSWNVRWRGCRRQTTLHSVRNEIRLKSPSVKESGLIWHRLGIVRRVTALSGLLKPGFCISSDFERQSLARQSARRKPVFFLLDRLKRKR